MRKQEKFRSALAVSLALHLLLLWPAVDLIRQGETTQTLSVVLRQGKGSVPEKAASASPDLSRQGASSGVREANTARDDKLSPVQAVATQAALPQQNSALPSNTPPSTTETAARSEGVSAGLAAAGGQTSPQIPATAGTQGLDADGVRQYRMALAVEARRFKHYPRRALADEVGGTVEVRVAVAAGGQTQEVALARSSGNDTLDDAALEMLRKAAPRTAVPELLRRRSFVINLPVVFDVASEWGR